MSPEAFKAFILRKKGVIPLPQTLGEHLRNRRSVLDFRQEDVARQLGTLREVYERWERDERQPVVSKWPGPFTSSVTILSVKKPLPIL